LEPAEVEIGSALEEPCGAFITAPEKPCLLTKGGIAGKVGENGLVLSQLAPGFLQHSGAGLKGLR
jgi:hypothetical protein